jgi:ion channel-forming bestrophin family protein
MHIGKAYKLSEFLVWTKGTIYLLLVLGILPVVLYQVFGFKWLAIPWTVVALLGTATAFIVGFKNTHTYNRTWEAQQTWVSIANASKTWGVLCRDYLNNPEKSKELIYRHFAWLTALRYQMREPRDWETTSKKYNSAYKKYYSIPEKEISLETELAKYMPADQLKYLLSTRNPATQIMSIQSKEVKELFTTNEIIINSFLELQKAIKEFFDLQGKSERIKNFPYPRQYATINRFFINLFCLLLPFGMLKEFDKLNESVVGLMKGNMIWLVVPFSVIISWMYTSLEQVGESSENPFEGSANDVPISHISRSIEIDLREMLGETGLPPYLQPKNNIIL